MKISNKISLSFFVGSIFLGVVATSVIYKIGNESLNALVSNQLRTIVISRSVHIETILEGYKKINEMLATGNIFKNAVDISKDYNERIDQANKRIKNTLQSFPAISRIRLLDENGIVIASSHKDIGFDESTERIFLKGREGVFIEDIHVSKITGNIVVRVASPVTLNGEFAGVAIINFNEKELFGIAMDKTGLGKTGEIYFVDKNGYIISPSRFKDKSFLKIRVNYEDIKKIGIEKQEHIFSIYSNYRGIEVLGVREHISLLKGSIVAEIDKNEALELLLKMQNLLIFIVIFIFFGSWLIGLFVGRIISQPILMLKKGSEIIGLGNLDYKVGTSAKDEVGQLSRAFDKMTENLKMSVVSKDYVENIINNMVDILLVVTPNGKIAKINRTALDHLGYDEQELVGKDVNVLFQEEGKTFKGTKLQELIKEGLVANYEINLKRKDGKKVPVLLSSTVMRDQNDDMTDIVCCIAKNITESKKAQEDLKQAHANTKVILEKAQVGVVVIGRDKKIIWANERTIKMAGVENIDDLVGKSCGEYLCPADQDKCPILDLNKRVDNSERILRRKDGREIPIIKTVNEINFDNKDVLLETFIDISERKKAEECLKESEEKVRTLYDSSSDAIMLLDEKGFYDCNEATLRLFGCSTKEEFCNKHPADFSPPTQPNGIDSISYARNNIIVALKEGYNRFEHLHCRLDGTNFFAEVLLDVMVIGGRKVLQARVYDLTERKKAEKKLKQVNRDLLLNERALKNMLYDISKTHQELENTQAQLVQSEKLSSLGQLSAGIAHEINNPLGFISNNVDILDEYINNYTHILRVMGVLKKTIEDKDLDKAASVVKEINKLDEKLNLEFIASDIGDLIQQTKCGTDRIKKIINDLKIFSRKDEGRLDLSNVEEILDRVINIVWNEIKYKIGLKKEYGGIPLVRCNTQKIGQVFINLILNASQAVKEKGEIKIKTYLVGKYVCIEISDTGSGIRKEDIDKIFDPFFTTKEVGKGTGLGLSIGYDIIKQHGGEIKVESEVNKGTKFIIKLPV